MKIDGEPLITAMPGEVLERDMILRILHTLEEVTDKVLADFTAAARNRQELYDAEEVRHPDMGKRTTPEVSIDPVGSMINHRTLLAEECEDRLEDAAYAFTAWWADVSVCAVAAALTGLSVTVVRVRAADPAANMEDDELALLPAVPEHVQKYAELAVLLDEPFLSGHDLGPGLLPVGGREYAERVGLRVRSLPDGRVTVVAGGWPEARRRRLWGPQWLEHRAPVLPDTGLLIRHLAEVDAPTAMIAAIREVAVGVDNTVEAKVHADELQKRMEELADDQSEGVADKVRQLEDQANAAWKQGDELPYRLAAYARVLTSHLPTLYRLCDDRSADDTP
ncbi:hypothetical protein [Spongiactinospora sp. 9N601]|uniref:hypothetical protein n=1 Tax=Spongiactinospora sp. 9N601 TaxID=3375149 RepID=UPI003791C455